MMLTIPGRMRLNLWRLLWEGQGGRCFYCATPIQIEKTYKNSNRFQILCESCFDNPEYNLIIFDDYGP